MKPVLNETINQSCIPLLTLISLIVCISSLGDSMMTEEHCDERLAKWPSRRSGTVNHA